jgi:hypothetical protein
MLSHILRSYWVCSLQCVQYCTILQSQCCYMLELHYVGYALHAEMPDYMNLSTLESLSC